VIRRGEGKLMEINPEFPFHHSKEGKYVSKSILYHASFDLLVKRIGTKGEESRSNSIFLWGQKL
jgi:hypothetical protein